MAYSVTCRTLLTIPTVTGYLSPRNSMIAKEYIERLDVAYGENASEAPSGCLREVHGLSPEIMFGEGEK